MGLLFGHGQKYFSGAYFHLSSRRMLIDAYARRQDDA
jgi:hypothetical protein